MEIGGWQRFLLNEGLSRKTVREGHVGCVKSFHSWAVGSGELEIDPAAGSTVAHEKVTETEATRPPDLIPDPRH